MTAEQVIARTSYVLTLLSIICLITQFTLARALEGKVSRMHVNQEAFRVYPRPLANVLVRLVSCVCLTPEHAYARRAMCILLTVHRRMLPLYQSVQTKLSKKLTVAACAAPERTAAE